MPISVRPAGSFVEAVPSVRVAGVWQDVQAAFVRVAGVWEEVYRALSVIMPNTSNSQSRPFGSPSCVAGIRFGSDGNYYLSNSTGGYSASSGAWLGAGTSGEVYVEVSVSGVALDVAPAGRVQLNVNRDYEQEQTATGSSFSGCTFSFYDAAAGGNLLDTAIVNLSAEIQEL